MTSRPFRLRDRADVLGRARVDVDRLGGLGPDRDLVHVERGAGIEHRPALGDGDHGDRIRLPERRQARPLERVDGDVDLGAVAGADHLAVVEHRRLVLLALADHDDAVHLDGAEHQAHRVDGSLVGLLLLAPPDPAGRSERRGLCDADELEGEVAYRVPWRSIRRRAYIVSGASTPIRSSERAITDFVAVTRPSRNASASEPSTLCSW